MMALQENPNLKQKELVEKAGISISTVQREIKWLSENGYIIRVGSKKKGYWEVEKEIQE